MTPELPYELPNTSTTGQEALVTLLLAGFGASLALTHGLAWSWGFHPGLGEPFAAGRELQLVGLALGAVFLPLLLWLLARRPGEPVTLALAVLGLPIAFALGTEHLYRPMAWLEWRAAILRELPGKPHLAPLRDQVHGAALWAYGTALALVGLRLVLTQRARGDVQGSARFARPDEVRRLGMLEGKTGVVIGGQKRLVRTQLYHAPDRRHVGVFGPSGCGKTTKIVIPTLLTETSSMVVLDIKMELYAATAGYRHEALGQTIHAFAPSIDAPWVSAYNPLLDIPRGPQETAFAQALARTLVDPDGKMETPDFWQSSAQSLLTAAILHTLYTGPDRSLAGVLTLLASSGKGIRDRLEEMRATEHDPSRPFFDFEAREETGSHPAVLIETAKLLDQAPETLTGIVATARSKLSLFLDPVVAGNTRRHDFSLADLGNPAKPTTLYLVLPARDLGRLSGLLRLFLQQLSYHLTGALSTETLPDGRLKPAGETDRRLVLMLDELAAVGRLDLVARQIAFLRGYGIQIVAAVQTANQLYDIYGQHESVRGNLSYLLVFPSTEQKTAEEVSKLLGDQTLYVESTSRSSGQTVFASRRSVSLRDQKRPLLTPDEVRRLGNDHPLLLATGAHPIPNQLPGYFQIPELARRAHRPPPLPDKGAAPDVRCWTENRTGRRTLRWIEPLSNEAHGRRLKQP